MEPLFAKVYIKNILHFQNHNYRANLISISHLQINIEATLERYGSTVSNFRGRLASRITGVPPNLPGQKAGITAVTIPHLRPRQSARILRVHGLGRHCSSLDRTRRGPRLAGLRQKSGKHDRRRTELRPDQLQP
jgi:hypothetical protein